MVMVLPMYEIVEQDGLYYNTAAVIDADGTVPRQVPQAAHPADQGLLGEVLLHPRRRAGTRSSRPPSARSACTSATTATSPRAGGPRPQRRPDRVQPVGHVSRGLSQYLWKLEQPARRGGQHVLRRRDQPGRHRAAGRRTTSTGRATSSTREGKFVGEVGDPYKPELIVRDLDMDKHQEVRDRWAFYRDRRPDAYDETRRPLTPPPVSPHGGAADLLIDPTFVTSTGRSRHGSDTDQERHGRLAHRRDAAGRADRRRDHGRRARLARLLRRAEEGARRRSSTPRAST